MLYYGNNLLKLSLYMNNGQQLSKSKLISQINWDFLFHFNVEPTRVGSTNNSSQNISLS